MNKEPKQVSLRAWCNQLPDIAMQLYANHFIHQQSWLQRMKGSKLGHRSKISVAMCLCICVSVCSCVFVSVCECVCVCVCVCVSLWVTESVFCTMCLFVWVCMFVCVFVCVCVCVCVSL